MTQTAMIRLHVSSTRTHVYTQLGPIGPLKAIIYSAEFVSANSPPHAKRSGDGHDETHGDDATRRDGTETTDTDENERNGRDGETGTKQRNRRTDNNEHNINNKGRTHIQGAQYRPLAWRGGE